MAKQQIVTSIRIDDQLWKAARIYAISKGITLTEFMEKLLRQELEKNEAIFKFIKEQK